MKGFFLSIVDINKKGLLSPKTTYCPIDPNSTAKGENLSPELIWGKEPNLLQ